VLTQLITPVNVGGVEALLKDHPEPGVTVLTPTRKPLILRHTPQPPNLRPGQVPQIADVNTEGLYLWTSGKLWLVNLVLTLHYLLNCCSPLPQSRMCVSSTSSRTRPGK
jgi:hypothetical protein